MDTEVQRGLGSGRRRAFVLAGAALLAVLLLAVVAAQQAEALKDTRAKRQAILREARSHVGERYRLGTPEPCRRNAVDCECLVRLVYRKFGRHLPNTMSEQARAGDPRSLRGMRKGDIMYFKDRRGRISHVGIYYDRAPNGDRRVIHSANRSTGVLISRVKDIEPRFAGVRDVLRGNF